MGRRNYLVEGGSGTGKSSVCAELRRRGYHVIDGDTELAYQGDPESGETLEGITGTAVHRHHIWPVDEVRASIADRDAPVTFFCGGSRNYGRFIDLFDGVFVLEVEAETLGRRLDARAADEWGGRPAERELIESLHRTREEVPFDSISIDATASLIRVVDDILGKIAVAEGGEPR